MAQTRRNFIKFIVAGSVAAGCPIDETLLASADSKGPGGALVHGEDFEICHQLRSGYSFERPAATRRADIVIVGGGVAGLSAAYFLRGKDWLLLEKEPQFGGNALQEEFEATLFRKNSKARFTAPARPTPVAAMKAINWLQRSASNCLLSTCPIPPSSTKPSSRIPGKPASISFLIREKCAKASRNFATIR